MVSWEDFANIKIPSADLKSKNGKLFPRANPNKHPSAFRPCSPFRHCPMKYRKIKFRTKHATLSHAFSPRHVSNCFALRPPEHYEYDPIGTWGKWRTRGPQNVKQRIADHFAKRAVWPPRAICNAMGKIDVWCATVCHPILPVDVHACETAYCQSSPASQLCTSSVQQLMTKIAPMRSWQQKKLAFGKLFRPWWNREEFQSHIESVIHSSHRLRPNPPHSLAPNQQLIATFCAVVRWCFLTALSSVPTCANWKAWLAWQQHWKISSAISNSRVCL